MNHPPGPRWLPSYSSPSPDRTPTPVEHGRRPMTADERATYRHEQTWEPECFLGEDFEPQW